MRSLHRYGLSLLLIAIIGLTILLWSYVRQIVTSRPTIAVVKIDRPLGEYCVEAQTTTDFNEFWLRFRTAVEAEDRKKLFALMRTCAFIWEQAPKQPNLQLKQADCVVSAIEDCHYPELMSGAPQIFEDRRDFDLNYDRVFSKDIRRRVLTGAPWQENVDRYLLSWDSARDESCSLVFERVDKVGYKFTGLEWGPYPVSFLKEEAKRPPNFIISAPSAPPPNSIP